MKFKVMLRGQNFLIMSDGQLQRLGFYTTRFVEAKDPKEAEMRAVQLVREDEKLKGCVKNERPNPPMLFLEEIEQVSRFPRNRGKGYTFYPDDEKQ